MSYYYVIGIRMDNRIGNASALQKVLTENGCKIKARLGLHEVSEDLCATDASSSSSHTAKKRRLSSWSKSSTHSTVSRQNSSI